MYDSETTYPLAPKRRYMCPSVYLRHSRSAFARTSIHCRHDEARLDSVPDRCGHFLTHLGVACDCPLQRRHPSAKREDRLVDRLRQPAAPSPVVDLLVSSRWFLPEKIMQNRFELSTARLILIGADKALLRAELDSQEALALAIDSAVPAAWPPEHHDRDVIEWVFRSLDVLAPNDPWRFFYMVLDRPRTLVRTCGIKRAPDKNGCVEVGYSVLEQFRWRGTLFHSMRPKRSSASTLVSQSVKPFHPLIEQVALLSHALAPPILARPAYSTLEPFCWCSSEGITVRRHARPPHPAHRPGTHLRRVGAPCRSPPGGAPSGRSAIRILPGDLRGCRADIRRPGGQARPGRGVGPETASKQQTGSRIIGTCPRTGLRPQRRRQSRVEIYNER